MPAVASWRVVLTDLQGVILGDLSSSLDRSLTLPLNRVPTFSFRIPIWNERANDLSLWDTLVKVYRDQDLVFIGPVISIDETAESQNAYLAVTAAGPFWRLTKRFLGKTKAGWAYGLPSASASGNPTGYVDLGTIAQAMLQTVNADTFTGIEVGFREDSTPGGVGPWYWKNVAEGITEISAGINSFDYVVKPTEPVNVGKFWPKIGELEIHNLLGDQRPDAIFEYGTSRANVGSYTRARSWDQICNSANISVSGWPDGTTKEIVNAGDIASITSRGLYEDIVSDSGIEDDGLRLEIVQEHLKYRASPKDVINFKPVPNAIPRPFDDYKVGDFVRGRAFVGGNIRFDAMFRIWGIKFDIDKNGNENLDLQLVQE